MSVSISMNKASKSSTSLWLLLAAFVIPVILAKCALTFNWLSYGVTNKGELLQQPLTLKQLGLDGYDFDHRWLILVNVPNDCAGECQQRLASIHNTFIALGRERPRVLPVALIPAVSKNTHTALIDQVGWHQIELPEKAKKYLSTGQVLIADPQNNIVLSHQVPADANGLALFGKRILADLKKLLKYSRIG